MSDIGRRLSDMSAEFWVLGLFAIGQETPYFSWMVLYKQKTQVWNGRTDLKILAHGTHISLGYQNTMNTR